MFWELQRELWHWVRTALTSLFCCSWNHLYSLHLLLDSKTKHYTTLHSTLLFQLHRNLTPPPPTSLNSFALYRGCLSYGLSLCRYNNIVIWKWDDAASLRIDCRCDACVVLFDDPGFSWSFLCCICLKKSFYLGLGFRIDFFI